MLSDKQKKEFTATRRYFIKISIRIMAGIGLFCGSLSTAVQHLWAQAKRIILPKGTKLSSLIDRNPATLDARNLEIMPLEEFQTMGLTDHPINPDQWRLEVTGKVQKPLQLTYAQILELPAIERNVLLICPGFFTNHGRWKGISVAQLLQMAEAQNDITHVRFRGPDGRKAKVKKFPINEIASDKIFLAYQVNGKVLPVKHGYPLRLVAEDYYGHDWVKYVHKIEFQGE